MFTWGNMIIIGTRSTKTSLSKLNSTEIMLRPAPSSRSVLVTAMLLMVGVQTRGIVPTVLVDLGWSRASLKEFPHSAHRFDL